MSRTMGAGCKLAPLAILAITFALLLFTPSASAKGLTPSASAKGLTPSASAKGLARNRYKRRSNNARLAALPSDTNVLYTVRQGDTWSLIQSRFSSKCQADSISIPTIAAENNVADWTSYAFAPGTPLAIPCVPKSGPSCGCMPATPVCGADSVNYDSYCEARCNAATPVSPNGLCSTCSNACMGRYGNAPSPASACPKDFVCPYPNWPPPLSDAASGAATSPMCDYRNNTCANACAGFNAINNLAAGDTGCYNSCMACQRVPCAGPSDVVPQKSSWCLTCASPGCLLQDSQCTGPSCLCAIDCSYWNSLWNPLKP